jgi:hypothetical protein
MRCFFCTQVVEIERQARSNACRRCSDAQRAPKRASNAHMSLDELLRQYRRDALICRGLDRAARGRLYDTIQTGGRMP